MLPELSADEIVVEAVAGLLDLDEAALSMDQDLATLEGWDSVNALRVLVFLERQTATALDFDRFSQAACLADLVALVADALNEAEPAA